MAETDGIAEALFDRGTLMDLYIGKPTFQKKLRPNDVLLEDIDENVLYLGHKKLLPPKALEQLVKLEGQARTALASRSLPFPLSGARFVYYAALQPVMARLKQIQDQWDAAVEDLVKDYPNLKEQQLVELDKQAQVLYQAELQKVAGVDRTAAETRLKEWVQQQRTLNRELYPAVEKIREMFHFSWRMFKISALEGVEEMSTLQQEDLQKAQQQLREDLQKWVQQAAVEMHKALGEAAANAAKLLQKNDKLDPRNLKPLFEAFETFKAIDFTGSSNFHSVVENIKSRFGRKRPDGTYDMELTSADLKNNPQGMQEFKTLLSNLGQLATDDVAEQAGITTLGVGVFRRLVEV